MYVVPTLNTQSNITHQFKIVGNQHWEKSQIIQKTTLLVTEPVTTRFPQDYGWKCWSLLFAEKYGNKDTIALSYETSVFVIFVCFLCFSDCSFHGILFLFINFSLCHWWFLFSFWKKCWTMVFLLLRKVIYWKN